MDVDGREMEFQTHEGSAIHLLHNCVIGVLHNPVYKNGIYRGTLQCNDSHGSGRSCRRSMEIIRR